MNAFNLPKSGLTSALLLDIARLIQLSPTKYRLAIDHYQAIDKHLCREGGPFRDLVVRLYPQGSVAIGTVISSKFDHDEFDIDVVAELTVRPDTNPALILDALFEALNGAPGSLYHGKVTRRTRCVTVDYGEMHVDITPAVLLPQLAERTSVIFHAKETDPRHLHRHVIANPWGFAQWFEVSMPSALYFAEAIMRKAAEPAPPQSELEEKALPLIGLQMIKRWRNKVFEPRIAGGLVKRVPPSVILSYYTATLGGVRTTLLDELRAQARHLHEQFHWHDLRGTKLEVRNPSCNQDLLSDRWPGSLGEQGLFAADLGDLVEQIEKLYGGVALEEQQRIMSNLFGERPTRVAFAEFDKRYGMAANSGALHHHPGSGAVALGASGLMAVKTAAPALRTARTTNFGSE